MPRSRAFPSMVTIVLLAAVAATPAGAQVGVRRAPAAIPQSPTKAVARDPTYTPPKPPPPATAVKSEALVAQQLWDVMPGCAKAIAAARAEQLYALGCVQADANGWVIQRWDAATRTWFPMHNGSAMQIAAHPDGMPLVVRGDGRAYAWRTSELGFMGFSTLDAAWRPIDGDGTCWKGLAVDRSGVVRVECRNGGPGGFSLWRKSFGSGPTGALPGAVLRVAAAEEWTRWSPGLWAISSGGAIWRAVSSSSPAGLDWTQVPGCAVGIAAGGGQVWVIGCDDPDASGDRSIWRWNGSDWDRIPGRANQLAVSPEGTVYAVTMAGAILRYKGT